MTLWYWVWTQGGVARYVQGTFPHDAVREYARAVTVPVGERIYVADADDAQRFVVEPQEVSAGAAGA